ncbi:unnamed protein product [Camellia sinensis]
MSGQFTESCRTLGKANRNQMSGQFTESCRTHEGANRNQCRDSLQSLVGPLKKLTGINVGTVYRVLSDP